VVVVRSGSRCAGHGASRSAWRCAARAVSWPTAARASVAAGVAGCAAVSRRVFVRLLLGLPGAVLLGVLAARAAVPRTPRTAPPRASEVYVTMLSRGYSGVMPGPAGSPVRAAHWLTAATLPGTAAVVAAGAWLLAS